MIVKLRKPPCPASLWQSSSSSLNVYFSVCVAAVVVVVVVVDVVAADMLLTLCDTVLQFPSLRLGCVPG